VVALERVVCFGIGMRHAACLAPEARFASILLEIIYLSHTILRYTLFLLIPLTAVMRAPLQMEWGVRSR